MQAEIIGETDLPKIRQTNKFTRNFSLWGIIVFAFISTGCKQKPLSHEYVQIQDLKWKDTEFCNFHVDINAINTDYDVELYIRHTADYPYSNLWLFIDKVAPDSTISSDTISIDMADITGKWLAPGVGSVMTLAVSYQPAYQFKQKGEYQYNIRHGMRTETLQGIQAIGLKVDYHGKK